jgi:hypothetical protein
MLEEVRVRVGAREARAIDPGEVGRLDVRHRLPEARLDQVAVGTQVIDLRCEPLVALTQGRERRVIAEH